MVLKGHRTTRLNKRATIKWWKKSYQNRNRAINITDTELRKATELEGTHCLKKNTKEHRTKTGTTKQVDDNSDVAWHITITAMNDQIVLTEQGSLPFPADKGALPVMTMQRQWTCPNTHQILMPQSTARQYGCIWYKNKAHDRPLMIRIIQRCPACLAQSNKKTQKRILSFSTLVCPIFLHKYFQPAWMHLWKCNCRLKHRPIPPSFTLS